MSALSLVDLVSSSQWVAWRNEKRGDDVTKVPYVTPTRPAEADNSATWLSHDQAIVVRDAIVNGDGGGVGIELGQCGNAWLAGVDLDRCREPATGLIEPWAQEVIARLGSYAEVSPSNTGVKVFALVAPTDVPELRRIMGTKHGRQFKRANGSKHPPAIEFYSSNRYFTVTWRGLADASETLRTVPLDDLRWLITQAGPAFAGKAERPEGNGDDTSILGRLDTASKSNTAVAAALLHATTMRGGSRSEGAFGLGAALKRAGWSFADMKAALLACPATRAWAHEQDNRQFERIWARAGDQQPNTLLECITLDPIGKAHIPPRPWAYGRFLLFGTVAVLGAVDGGGKGAIAVVVALAMISGKPLLGERVWRTGPVVIVSYEDDETEWHRRIAAACDHYELDYEDVIRNVHFLHKPGGRISFAVPANGNIVFPDSAAIIQAMHAIGAVLLIIDPLNHAHSLDDGNNNVMIAKVAAEMNCIVAAVGAAGLVLHHLRKGSTGSPDDLMGATSLRATFRSCRILARMTPDVAEKLKITDPWRYIRITSSKENYSPPPDKASWFKLIGVRLGNGTDAYPDGDEVAVVTTWQPRASFEGMTPAILRDVFAALREADHSPNKQAKNTPWAGLPLIDIGGRNQAEAPKIIAAWLDSGVLTKEKYYHKGSKHEVERVILNEQKVAEILAEIDAVITPAD